MRASRLRASCKEQISRRSHRVLRLGTTAVLRTIHTMVRHTDIYIYVFMMNNKAADIIYLVPGIYILIRAEI